VGVKRRGGVDGLKGGWWSGVGWGGVGWGGGIIVHGSVIKISSYASIGPIQICSKRAGRFRPDFKRKQRG
jgi:hypothetical protein